MVPNLESGVRVRLGVPAPGGDLQVEGRRLVEHDGPGAQLQLGSSNHSHATTRGLLLEELGAELVQHVVGLPHVELGGCQVPADRQGAHATGTTGSCRRDDLHRLAVHQAVAGIDPAHHRHLGVRCVDRVRQGDGALGVETRRRRQGHGAAGLSGLAVQQELNRGPCIHRLGLGHDALEVDPVGVLHHQVQVTVHHVDADDALAPVGLPVPPGALQLLVALE